MEDTPEVEDSSPTAKSTTKPSLEAGRFYGSSRRKYKPVRPSPSSNVPSHPPSHVRSMVNYGPNEGWEPTFQALFRTPFFKRMSQRLATVREPERRKYTARIMGSRIKEELERIASLPVWSNETRGWHR